MDRRDWLDVEQIARLTQISSRTIWRYVRRPGVGRYKRRLPGGRRWLYHRHIVPKFREWYQEGLAATGRRFGNAATRQRRKQEHK
jgi:hypothetical protein